MTEQKLEGVNPTRMELLEIRKKIILAEKGHKLLEEKRDALVEKFFGIIDKRNLLSKEIDKKIENAFLSLIQAQMILGETKVSEISYLSKKTGELSFDTDNIMGVKIPKMKREEKNKAILRQKVAAAIRKEIAEAEAKRKAEEERKRKAELAKQKATGTTTTTTAKSTTTEKTFSETKETYHLDVIIAT